jgi:hypothetical protein
VPDVGSARRPRPLDRTSTHSLGQMKSPRCVRLFRTCRATSAAGTACEVPSGAVLQTNSAAAVEVAARGRARRQPEGLAGVVAALAGERGHYPRRPVGDPVIGIRHEDLADARKRDGIGIRRETATSLGDRSVCGVTNVRRFRIVPSPQDVGAEIENVLSDACGTSTAREVFGNAANGHGQCRQEKGGGPGRTLARSRSRPVGRAVYARTSDDRR